MKQIATRQVLVEQTARALKARVLVRTDAPNAHAFIVDLGDGVGSFDSCPIYGTRAEAWAGAARFLDSFRERPEARTREVRAALRSTAGHAPYVTQSPAPAR